MIQSAPYKRQVTLLMRVLPIVAQERCFALKGGTAINLFIRDMPRLSVDIDLAYLPLLPRDQSLQEIDTALKNIAAGIKKSIPGVRTTESTLPNTTFTIKLVINTPDAQIKIEVTPVLRGTVFPHQNLTVSDKVQDEYGFAEMSVLSFEDLYGGKLVAALDRQHPRDLYDVKLLFANEGLTRDVFCAFLVYLISHDRPMSEIIAPRFRNIREEFENGFAGMTLEPVSCEELERTREELVKRIKSSFTDDDKELLFSIKKGSPKWDLFKIPHVSKLPAVQWKLQNIAKLDELKRKALLERLIKVLE